MDSDSFTGEVIFTFDGDAAGMKAAERAFGDDQKFMAQTFVAIEATGMDPCELRQKSGDKAVLDLVARRIPLVEFVLRTTVDRFDLDTAEGQTAAIDAGIPLVAQIKDRALRSAYATRLAGLVGYGLEDQVVARVRGLERSNDRRPAATTTQRAPERDKVDEAVVSVEREVLKIALQQPGMAGPQFDALEPDAFLLPAHRSVREAIVAVGGAAAAKSGPSWVASIEEHLDEKLRSGVHALAVEPLRLGPLTEERYSDAILARMQANVVARQIAPLKSKIQRINPEENAEEHARLFAQLIPLEMLHRQLRDRAHGGA
jgi:DNA primase